MIRIPRSTQNGKPKPVLFSEVMSYLDISGIYCPFTFEANVNVHMNDVLIPVTMCHELFTPFRLHARGRSEFHRIFGVPAK